MLLLLNQRERQPLVHCWRALAVWRRLARSEQSWHRARQLGPTARRRVQSLGLSAPLPEEILLPRTRENKFPVSHNKSAGFRRGMTSSEASHGRLVVRYNEISAQHKRRAKRQASACSQRLELSGVGWSGGQRGGAQTSFLCLFVLFNLILVSGAEGAKRRVKKRNSQRNESAGSELAAAARMPASHPTTSRKVSKFQFSLCLASGAREIR